MASTSGSLVPPTWGRSGCSQNRVHATGVTSQASSVSVTDGTRLTTRGAAARRFARSAAHIRSRSCCFLAANSASVSRPCRRSSSSSRIWAGIEPSSSSSAVARRHRLADPVVLAVLVGLDLPVDLVLHGRRVAHVRERLAPHLARRLDDQVARAHHALEHRLAEEHRVDPVERDLDAVLGQHAVPVDQPVGGDDEVGGDPAGVAQAEPDEAAEDEHADGDLSASRRCPTATRMPRMIDPMRANIGGAKNHQCGWRSRTMSSLSFSSFLGNGTAAAYPRRPTRACNLTGRDQP